MKKILVTGGAGYVGSSLLRELLKEGFQVVCVDCLMFGGESLIDIWNQPNFTFYKCDILDYDQFDTILMKHKYEAVVHLAAIVGDPACKRKPELAEEVNWDASKRLIKMCIELDIPRFVFASTCSNYGKMPDPNSYVDEDSPLAPVSLYAKLKVKLEDLILNGIQKRREFSPTSLRFSTVYGISPRMRFDLTVNEFTKELALGKELVVFGEQFWRPYCHVLDFSRAILAVLKVPETKVAYNVFNVGSTEENYTKEMIVEELLKHFPDAAIKYVHKKEDRRDYRVSFDKIKRSLGFTVSKTLPDGIEEVKKAILWGVIQDPNDQRYYNIPHKKD